MKWQFCHYLHYYCRYHYYYHHDYQQQWAGPEPGQSSAKGRAKARTEPGKGQGQGQAKSRGRVYIRPKSVLERNIITKGVFENKILAERVYIRPCQNEAYNEMCV